MARYDIRLIAPTDTRLLDSLVEATARANQGVDLLHFGRHHWEDFLAQARNIPIGHRQWSDTLRGDTARVAVAWWTDHLHRRHFRILGGNSRDRSYRTLAAARTDPRPPLWHVYPDQVYYRERDGKGAWLAVCSCGMCGQPASLGWMGTACGPCHDRQQEGDPHPEVVLQRTIEQQATGSALAFTPDCRTLATVVAETVDVYSICLHDLTTGECRDLPPARRAAPQCLAFSPDGGLLAFTEGPDRLLVADPASGQVFLDCETDPGIRFNCLVFSPNGLRLAGGGEALGLLVWERDRWGAEWHLLHSGVPPSTTWTHTLITSQRHITGLAFSPDGNRLAVGGQEELFLLDLSNEGRIIGEAETLVDHCVRDLAFTPEGHLVACTSPQDVGWRVAMPAETPEEIALVVHRTIDEMRSAEDVSGGILRVYDVLGGAFRLLRSHPVPAMMQATLSPTAEHAAWLRGGNVVTMQEVATGRVLGRVGWDLARGVAGVTFSPDGHLLALLDEGGTVKLVPWHLLLQA
jgi:hypothetical protein